ncbi:MAG: phage terminase large subunit family protein [Planctomycetes bacterium]|nr:phage terminase large subunit family protein [Planctomycetota bacterium]
MPRGSGKTSLVEAAALWSLLYGHREFVAIIGSDEGHASTMLESIKIECETNELLLADFPEAVFPIVALERIHQRAKGQLFQGKPTHIQWTADEVQFPTIPGSAASSGIIRVAGITGRIRGMTAKRAADGRKVRPTLVLIDDPQTDESARSPSQVASREAVLKGAILGLAGPGVKISGLATVTVIQPDDLADRLLDRERHPAWHGRRMKLVYAWPSETSLWDQYAELRRRGQRDGVGTAAADEFYATHREQMDAGARVAWPARKQADELSAIQHAWNLRIDRGEAAFAAEFQNEPLLDENRSEAVSAADIIQHAIEVPRWIVPRGCDTLTAFIDVQKELLYYAVLAWGSGFRSHVVAYGAYPEQGRPYFTLREAKKTLSLAHGKNVEAAIHAGLTALMPQLLDREFTREDDDAVLRIGQVFIDANWAQSQGVVRDYARRSSYGPRVLPTHGRYVGASGQTISDKKPDKGERVGANWRTSTIGKQRHVLFDTNAWKTFMVARMKLPVGDPLGFTLHNGDHEMMAEQLASEVPVRVASKTRACDEWKLIPGRDNHLLDCVVGAAVAASFIGISAVGAESKPAAARKVISREDMAAKRAKLMQRLGRA